MSWTTNTKNQRNFSETLVIQQAGTTQSFPNGVNTKITIYNRVIRDKLSEWNNATSTFTPKESGLYLICAKIIYAPSTQGDQRNIFLYVNGVLILNMDFRISQGTVGNDEFVMNQGFVIFRLNANDAVNFYHSNFATGVISWDDPNINQLTIVQIAS